MVFFFFFFYFVTFQDVVCINFPHRSLVYGNIKTPDVRDKNLLWHPDGMA